MPIFFLDEPANALRISETIAAQLNSSACRRIWRGLVRSKGVPRITDPPNRSGGSSCRSTKLRRFSTSTARNTL